MTNEYGGGGFGRLAAAAGTPINRLVPPRPGGITRVSTLKATGADVFHRVTALRPLGTTTSRLATAAANAVLHLTADPGASISNPIAAGDYVAVREIDGLTRQYKVLSVSGTDVTLTTTLVYGAAVGAKVWFFGVAADTDPRTGEPHQWWELGAATVTFSDDVAGVVATLSSDEPVLLQHSNDNTGTSGHVAGTIDQVSYAYTSS